MNKIISKLCIILAILFVVLGFIIPFAIKEYVVVDGLKLNEVTSWLTNSMSVCFSLSSVFLVITTLNKNNDHESRVKFQDRFFRLYGIFNSIRERMGNEYFKNIIDDLDKELEKIDYEVFDSSSLRDIMYDTCSCYNNIHERERYKLGEYMSCFYSLIKFIDEDSIDKNEKLFCMDFLRSSLSALEKKIIFYHSFNNSSGRKFHDNLIKYDLLSGLDINSLIKGRIVNELYEKKIYN